MKMLRLLPLLAAFALGLHAESAKSYQVTGPVIALTDSTITVQKGDEKWEVARGAATKVDGKLAVGARVTVHYTMSAVKVDVKEAAPTEGAKKKSGKKAGN